VRLGDGSGAAAICCGGHNGYRSSCCHLGIDGDSYSDIDRDSDGDRDSLADDRCACAKNHVPFLPLDGLR
jgi:hypothetical protein